MWPWGHLGVAYLCYVAAIRIRERGEQTLASVTAVLLGSQFPDIVDKPLAWSFGILPSGRSLAHSLITAAIVLSLLYWVCRRVGRPETLVAFGIGYLSHLFADLGPDTIFGLLQGDWSQLQWTTYLLWPVLPAPPYPSDSSFMEHFLAFRIDPYVLFQFGLFAVAVGVWVRRGRSGLEELRDHY